MLRSSWTPKSPRPCGRRLRPMRRRTCQHPDDVDQGPARFDFTLPSHVNAPAGFAKSGRGACIAGGVGRELLAPELCARSGDGGALASGMLVPEAAVHKDCGPMSRQDYVGRSGKVAAVDPISIAKSMQSLAEQQLRLGSPRGDLAHQCAARRIDCGIELIGRSTQLSLQT